MALHAHMETYEKDCDGPVSDSWVATKRADEDDIDFHDRILRNVASVYAILSTGALEVTRFEEDDSIRLSWSEVTEEGFRNREATICKDEGCDTDETSHRDYYAEEMGY